MFWPGFESHPNHEIAKNQMNGFGVHDFFNLVGNKLQDAIKLVSNTHYFTLAESLGGVESLIGHFYFNDSQSLKKKERKRGC